MAEATPPAELGALIKAYLDLMIISPKLDNLSTLPPEEKIQVREQLKEITKVLNKMVKKGKKSLEQKTGS